MQTRNTRSNAVGWRFIEKKTGVRSTKDLQTSKSKPSKTIRRRTRILNKELKKIGRLRSYSQYVKIKTKVLREVSEVSEDESIEEESSEINRVAENQSLQESIRAPGRSNTKRSRTCKESSKSTQRQNDKHDGDLTNNPRKDDRSRAKKNLSRILDNLDEANLDTENIDRDVGDDNSTVSWRAMRKPRISVANVPAGDSGIEDNSQANSSPRNYENDASAELVHVSKLADQLAQEADYSQTESSQVDEAIATEEKNDESSSIENGAERSSLSDCDISDNKETLNKAEDAEELSEIDTNDDKVEEPVSRDATAEKSSQSDQDNNEIEEFYSKDERTETPFGSDEDEHLIESTSSTERVEKFYHPDDNDFAESPRKKRTVREPAAPDKGEDVIEECLAKEEEKFETLSQADEHADEIEAISTEEKSALKVSGVAHTDDNKLDVAWTEEETVETLHSDANDDSFKKKHQPTIMCTEIVRAKYTIIRDENEEEKELENHLLEPNIIGDVEPTENDELSSEADRVSKLKRINLLCSGTESDSSDEDDGPEQINVEAFARPALSSQVISDPSDSEDSDSLALHISDSEDGRVTSTPYCQQENSKIPPSSGLAKKSIKDQIKEQTIVGSPVRVEDESVDNTEAEEQADIAEDEENTCPEEHQYEADEKINDDTPKRKKLHKNKSHEREALQYVLKNISKRNSDCEDLAEACSRNEEENLPRPTELHEFVAREELTPTQTSSTLTLKDISKISEEQDDDEEIWLMEIPKSIVTDPGLRGQSIVIQKNQIKIGEINYNVTLKHTKAVSCILRKNEKKSRYKTVNIRPVYSINVRHARAEDEQLLASEASPLRKSVPFPKNIKSRNPLIAECKDELLSPGNTVPMTHKGEKNRQSTKKRKHSLWHVDNFILKRRRKKVDGCWADGSKEADFFNE